MQATTPKHNIYSQTMKIKNIKYHIRPYSSPKKSEKQKNDFIEKKKIIGLSPNSYNTIDDQRNNSMIIPSSSIHSIIEPPIILEPNNLTENGNSKMNILLQIKQNGRDNNNDIEQEEKALSIKKNSKIRNRYMSLDEQKKTIVTNQLKQVNKMKRKTLLPAFLTEPHDNSVNYNTSNILELRINTPPVDCKKDRMEKSDISKASIEKRPISCTPKYRYNDNGLKISSNLIENKILENNTNFISVDNLEFNNYKKHHITVGSSYFCVRNPSPNLKFFRINKQQHLSLGKSADFTVQQQYQSHYLKNSPQLRMACLGTSIQDMQNLFDNSKRIDGNIIFSNNTLSRQHTPISREHTPISRNHKQNVNKILSKPLNSIFQNSMLISNIFTHENDKLRNDKPEFSQPMKTIFSGKISIPNSEFELDDSNIMDLSPKHHHQDYFISRAKTPKTRYFSISPKRSIIQLDLNQTDNIIHESNSNYKSNVYFLDNQGDIPIKSNKNYKNILTSIRNAIIARNNCNNINNNISVKSVKDQNYKIKKFFSPKNSLSYIASRASTVIPGNRKKDIRLKNKK